MKKFNYLGLILIIGLSLILLSGCASQENTTASEDAEQAVGNMERIAMNEIAENEASIQRIGEEAGSAKDQEAVKLANELLHIKMHLETLQENVNIGYDQKAVTEANKMDIDSRIDEAKTTIDQLVEELKEEAGTYVGEISTDASAPIENVKTKEGLQKFVDTYKDNLDGIEADIKDGTVNKDSAKKYLEDMKAHVEYVTQVMDGLVSDKAISEDDKATFTKDFDDLNKRIEAAIMDLS